MDRILVLLFISVVISISARAQIDTALADELVQMAIGDQVAAHAFPTQEYEHLSLEEWKSFKDSVYRTHQKRLEEIMDTQGYPGYDLVGRSGESSFWVMAQHSDHNPVFQKRVLDAMRVEVNKGNANAGRYAYLVDRVKVNTGGQQVYGSQVGYDFITGKAKSIDLADPDNVNVRRKEVGLEPLEDYLAEMTADHLASTITGVIPDTTLILLLVPAVVGVIGSSVLRKKRHKKSAT